MNTKDTNDTQAVERMFAAYCRKTLINAKTDFLREAQRRARHERPFSDMTTREIDAASKRADAPDPDMGETVATGSGLVVDIADEPLANAIRLLADTDRDIVLMSYFADWSDAKISRFTGIPRSTVQFRRQRALRELRRTLDEEVRDA